MLEDLTIKSAHELLREKKISSRELTQAYLARAKEKNAQLNAYLSVNENEALAMADAADKRIAEGDAHYLTGVPLAVKDNILVEGVKATAASKILEPYMAAYDATVITNLKDENAVVLGKTNLDEFAMGASTENSAFGPTKNPYDSARVPGGSSGGSAAAVAADMAVAALGSDTGGSVRQPSGFCGVVGLNPTYGRVSRYGLMAMASSLDQVGPIAKTVWDAAALLEVLAGQDACDATTSRQKVPVYTNGFTGNIKGLRVGIPNEYFAQGIDEDVEKSVRAAIFKLEELGASIGGVSLPRTSYALATYYVIMPCEVSSNLARYDGIRYGYSVAAHRDASLLEVYTQSRGKGFGKEVQRRIMLGTYALSAGYYDAYYKKAQQVRTLIVEDFKKAFEEYDVLVSPTSPTPAFSVGEKADPLAMYLADIYTVSANIAGIPAVSVPCGFVERGGSAGSPQAGKKLPVGLQIMGKHFDESTILRVADAYERSQAKQ